jgi:diguanylate cyclase (GGDEF)-like protein/PAS domain S-box-containing protein
VRRLTSVPRLPCSADAADAARPVEDAGGLRALVQHLPEGVYVTTPDGAFVDANPALVALLGVDSADGLRALRAEDLFADPARRAEQLALLRRDGAIREFELWIIRPDGELRAVLDTAVLRRDPASGAELIHGVLRDVTRLRELEAQLLDLGTRDALTGCYNRHYLTDFEARLAARGEARWGCLFIDVDKFKLYNDRYGHHAGDAVLTQMARFLRGQLRGEEAVVRVGGDEFVLVLVGADERRTQAVARSLAVSARRTAPVAFSLGWAVREGGERLERTMQRADQQLLQVRGATRPGGWPVVGGVD